MSKEQILSLAQELVSNKIESAPASEPEGQAEQAPAVEQEGEQGQSSQEASVEPDLIELKAVGEVHKLSLDQIKELASKGFDYSRKMQEIPERVKQETAKQVEERTKETQAERTRLLESCALVESFYGQPFVTAAQLDQLIQDGDTETYLKLSRQEEKRKELLSTAKAERQKVIDAQAKEDQENFHKNAIQHTHSLFEKMPELKETPAQIKLASYLKSAGFSDQDIAGFIDHRGLIIAEKARRYDELAGGKAEPVRKDPPKVIRKVGGTVDKQTYTQKDLEESRKKLEQSGKLRDAASLYLKMKSGVK